MKLNSYQIGGIAVPQDNTRVNLKIPIKYQLSPQQKEAARRRKLEEAAKKRQAYIYDGEKAKQYQQLQNFYNNNFFGYGVFGKQTRYNPATPEGQQAIQSNFEYAKGNARDFVSNVAGVGITKLAGKAANKSAEIYHKLTKGVFKTPSKNGALGTLKQYSKNPIGSGAEAVVVRNTPRTVGKMTSIPKEEMAARNQVPNTAFSEYIGYVKENKTKLPTYIQEKLKIISERSFPRYITKLDKLMERSGFRRVNDPNVQYRAYTNGQIVVDDVAPGNVGLNWLGRPKMIDFNMQSVPEWIAQGFTLKKGGKL